MRRSLWFRTAASLLALWIPLITGEPGLLQPCPMHGAGQLVMASLGGHPAEHSQHAPTHSHHATASAEQSHVPASNHNHHSCTCIDGCTVSGVAFVAPTLPVTSVASAEVNVGRSVPSVETLARPAPAFSRPYTTGPPRA